MNCIKILSCEEERFIASVLAAQNKRDGLLGVLVIFLLCTSMNLIALLALVSENVQLLIGFLPLFVVLSYAMHPTLFLLVADKKTFSPIMEEVIQAEQFQVSYDDNWKNTPYLAPWFYKSVPWPTVGPYRMETILINSPSRINIKYIVSVEGGFNLSADLPQLPNQTAFDIFLRPLFLKTRRGCGLFSTLLIMFVSTCLLVFVFEYPVMMISLLPLVAITYISIRTTNVEEKADRYVKQAYGALFRERRRAPHSVRNKNN